MIKHKRQRDRLTARDWASVRSGINSAKIGSSPVGLNVVHSLSGSIITGSDPMIPRAVYVVGFNGSGMVLVKEAVNTPAADVGFTIVQGNESLEVAQPFPGYTDNHFIYDVIGPDDLNDFTPPGYQPQAKDRVAIMVGGYVKPDPRMRLVAPAAVDEICQPLPPSPILPESANPCACDNPDGGCGCG